jgi:hypothetical protein
VLCRTLGKLVNKSSRYGLNNDEIHHQHRLLTLNFIVKFGYDNGFIYSAAYPGLVLDIKVSFPSCKYTLGSSTPILIYTIGRECQRWCSYYLVQSKGYRQLESDVGHGISCKL